MYTNTTCIQRMFVLLFEYGAVINDLGLNDNHESNVMQCKFTKSIIARSKLC